MNLIFERFLSLFLLMLLTECPNKANKQRELRYLIFVDVYVLVLLLSLALECDDNETHEDVDHEEGDDDDVDEEVDGHQGAVVVHGTHVLRVGVDGRVQKTGNTRHRQRQSLASRKPILTPDYIYDTNLEINFVWLF